MVTGLKNSPDAPPSAPVPSIGPRRAINEVYQLIFPGTIAGVFKLKSVTVTNNGTGYAALPTISFTGGGGSGAAAIAALAPPGFGTGVWSITPTDDGTEYSTPPTVVITPAGGDPGAGATAIAVMQQDTSAPGATALARFPPVIVPLGCSVSIRGGNGTQPNTYNAYAARYAEQLNQNGRVQISPDTEIDFPCDNLNQIVCAGVPGDGLTVFIRGSAIG